MLINGRSMPTFMETDWPGICKIIRDADAIHHSVINNNLKNCLRELSTAIRDKAASPKPCKLTNSAKDLAGTNQPADEPQGDNCYEYTEPRSGHANQIPSPDGRSTPPNLPRAAAMHMEWARNALSQTSLPSAHDIDTGMQGEVKNNTYQTPESTELRICSPAGEINVRKPGSPPTLDNDIHPRLYLEKPLPMQTSLRHLSASCSEMLPASRDTKTPLDVRLHVLAPTQSERSHIYEGVPTSTERRQLLTLQWQETTPHQRLRTPVGLDHTVDEEQVMVSRPARGAPRQAPLNQTVGAEMTHTSQCSTQVSDRSTETPCKSPITGGQLGSLAHLRSSSKSHPLPVNPIWTFQPPIYRPPSDVSSSSLGQEPQQDAGEESLVRGAALQHLPPRTAAQTTPHANQRSIDAESRDRPMDGDSMTSTLPQRHNVQDHHVDGMQSTMGKCESPPPSDRTTREHSSHPDSHTPSRTEDYRDYGPPPNRDGKTQGNTSPAGCNQNDLLDHLKALEAHLETRRQQMDTETLQQDENKHQMELKAQQLERMSSQLQQEIGRISSMEKEVLNREKKASLLEKALAQREKDLNKRHAQHESASACIVGLEARIKELETSNRILQQMVNATGRAAETSETHGPPSPPQTLPNTSPTTDSLNPVYAEISKLREEMRMRDMENRVTSQMNQMEQRMSLQMMQTFQSLQAIQTNCRTWSSEFPKQAAYQNSADTHHKGDDARPEGRKLPRKTTDALEPQDQRPSRERPQAHSRRRNSYGRSTYSSRETNKAPDGPWRATTPSQGTRPIQEVTQATVATGSNENNRSSYSNQDERDYRRTGNSVQGRPVHGRIQQDNVHEEAVGNTCHRATDATNGYSIPPAVNPFAGDEQASAMTFHLYTDSWSSKTSHRSETLLREPVYGRTQRDTVREEAAGNTQYQSNHATNGYSNQASISPTTNGDEQAPATDDQLHTDSWSSDISHSSETSMRESATEGVTDTGHHTANESTRKNPQAVEGDLSQPTQNTPIRQKKDEASGDASKDPSSSTAEAESSTAHNSTKPRGHWNAGTAQTKQSEREAILNSSAEHSARPRTRRHT